MAGHHPFRDLFKDWSAARLARVNEKKRRLLDDRFEREPQLTSVRCCRRKAKSAHHRMRTTNDWPEVL